MAEEVGLDVSLTDGHIDSSRAVQIGRDRPAHHPGPQAAHNGEKWSGRITSGSIREEEPTAVAVAEEEAVPLKQDVERGDGDDAFEDHSGVVIENTHSPNKFFRPTHADVVVDGKRYKWNARAHRKLRFVYGEEEDEHPASAKHRIHFFCWEPKIVTWYICWIGVIANTLWVVNGLYAVWPERSSRSTLISFGTGVAGAFLFIVTGYLGWIEACNQTHGKIQMPTLDEERRREFVKQETRTYGQWKSPIPHQLSVEEQQRQLTLLKDGYPLVQDELNKKIVTGDFMDQALEYNGPDLMGQKLVGRVFDVRIGKHVLSVTTNSWKLVEDEKITTVDEKGKEMTISNKYDWWPRHPEYHVLAIFANLIMFISTIIFFIPAVLWYIMDNHGAASRASNVFWIYVTQMIPSIGFVFVGHASQAEVSGSWIKPKFNDIGWWTAFFNTVGGYGFLLYAVLATPSAVGNTSEGLYKWGAAMATFWGSCCFEVAGLLACVEFSSQHPILLGKKK